MAKMRSIPEAVKELCTSDPGTRITVHTLRQWVKDGSVPCVKVGRQALVNMDILEAYMSGGGQC